MALWWLWVAFDPPLPWLEKRPRVQSNPPSRRKVAGNVQSQNHSKLGWPFGLYLGELAHKAAGGPGRIGAARLADPEELHNVHAALAQLQAADEAVFAAEFPGQLPLGQPGVLAQLHEGPAATLPLLGVDPSVRCRLLPADR